MEGKRERERERGSRSCLAKLTFDGTGLSPIGVPVLYPEERYENRYGTVVRDLRYCPRVRCLLEQPAAAAGAAAAWN
eukprot:COSAG02_NODE_43443_length_374_cov_16.607273_1_plen_76_part_01